MVYELHSYIDNNIEFEYSVNSTNETNIIIELYRGKLFCYIIKEFINKSILLFGIKIFSIKIISKNINKFTFFLDIYTLCF